MRGQQIAISKLCRPVPLTPEAFIGIAKSARVNDDASKRLEDFSLCLDGGLDSGSHGVRGPNMATRTFEASATRARRICWPASIDIGEW